MGQITVQVYQEDGEPDVLTEFLEGLSDKNDVKKVRKLIRMLQTQGRELGLPVSKFLGAGLYELRDRSSGIRVYYTFIDNTFVILLALGDKKTQDRDMKQAWFRREKLLIEIKNKGKL